MGDQLHFPRSPRGSTSQNKTIIPVTLVLLLVGSLFAVGTVHGQAVVAFDPANDSVDCGQSVFVDLTVDNTITDLQGFSFTFAFDPTYVTPISVTEGSLLSGAGCDRFFSWTNELTFTNTIEIDASLLGCTVVGPGTILTIEFASTANRGQSPLTVLQSRVRNSNNAEIAIIPPTGTVDNICNTAPVTANDTYTVTEGGTITAIALGAPAGVLDNDSDTNGDALNATIVTAPLNATSFTLNLDGSFNYVHDSTETVSDSFVYAADDGFGGTTQGTASITVTGVNDPPVVTSPGPQTSAETDAISLPILATDPELGTLQYLAIGLPTGLSIDLNTGLISGIIDCAASAGSPYNVTIDVDDQGLLGVTQIVFVWHVTAQAAPTAITDLVSTQVKVGNDNDGTTLISLTWTGGPAAVYRKGYGSYPEYDDDGGSVPVAPVDAAAALLDSWVLVAGVMNSGDSDEPSNRDSFYYVAYAQSSCGTESAVSNLTGGVLNYHLGDVTDGVTPGVGDNLTNSADISALGSSYNVDSLDPLYLNYLDVGPTTDFSLDGRPSTDNVIEFEDLMMFSLNYGYVSKSGPLQAPQNLNILTLMTPPLTVPGTTVEIPLWLQGDGQIHGMSIPLTWNPAVVAPVGYASGFLLGEQGNPALCYEAEPGFVDIAVFGTSTTGLTGTGVAATITFEVLATGDPQFGFGDLRVRGSQNQNLTLTLQTGAASSVPQGTPRVSGLYSNYPNPFNPSTTVSFGIAEAGAVSLRIYAVDGRLVRTVISQNMVPGSYNEVWDGTNGLGAQVASGIYYVRLIATDHSESKSITLLK